MEEVQIFDRLKELDKIIDPRECNLLANYINGYITDYEEELHELNLKVSNKWLELRQKVSSVAEADKYLEIDENFRRKERVKLSMAQLKRMRSDLKDRFRILTFQKL